MKEIAPTMPVSDMDAAKQFYVSKLGFNVIFDRAPVFRSKESPNTLKFTPYHINAKFLGQEKDVAYVTYYLVGKIVREGKDDIANYRTRASNVMEKTDGKWVNSGAHYSPLFGGSGVE